MKFLSVGLLALSVSLSALAAETKICIISSDIDAEITEMFIETKSNGDLDSLRLYKTLGSQVISDETHPVEKVVDYGIVASERQGREVVSLQAKNYNPSVGGIISVDYLYNGLTNSRKVYNLKITRNGSNYTLTTMDGVKVNRIKFIANRAPVVGKLLGIKEVRASFK